MHGSFVVMHGGKMQEGYQVGQTTHEAINTLTHQSQHIIDAQSLFHFALTFRHIFGEHVKKKKKKKKKKGKVPPKCKAENYDDEDDDNDDDDVDDNNGAKRRKLDIETRHGRRYVVGTNQPARSVYDEQLDTDDMDTPGVSSC